MSYVLTFVGFAALIILHELGHFVAAKAVGMRVERFSLFFGKPIFSRTRGETEYRIGIVPLGGYVKISGMSPYEELAPDVAHRAYLRQPAWKRILVITAGPFVNLLIFLILVFAVLWHQGAQNNAFSVAQIEKAAPASHQLALDDRVLSVDGIAAYAPHQSEAQFERRETRVAAAIQRHACATPRTANCIAATAVTVVVQRGGRRMTLRIRPRYEASPPPARMRLGIGWGVATTPIGAGTAARLSFSDAWTVTKATVSTLGRIFTSAKARKQLNSAVGAYEITREQLTDNGFGQALKVLALISLSLAIINLFPFLPLDGGHIAWAVAEKIRGKAVPFRLVERYSAVGFVLIIFVFLIGLSNDIGHLTGSGFGVQH
jgi:regulator of sigma E protease